MSRSRTRPAIFALALLAGGCGGDAMMVAPPGADSTAAPVDLAAPDLAPPGLADLASRDFAAKTDQARPDAAPLLDSASTSDLAAPGLDQSVPDLAAAEPDLRLPDLARPPADLAPPGVAPGTVVINEIHSTNLTGLLDEDGDEEDWIELYNTTARPVDLTGVGLSDSGGALFRWRFPPGSAIPARSHLVVFTSKKNRAVWTRPLHTDFAVESGADRVYLTSPGGAAIDTALPPRGKPNLSWCRSPDATGPFHYCMTPTPGAANQGLTAQAMLAPPTVSIPGGFYPDEQTVTLATGEPGAEIRFTLDGAEPSLASPVYNGPIKIGSRVGAANRYANVPTTVSGFYTPLDSEVYKGTVLRAAAFANGKLSSPINTHTYFVDPNGAGRYAGVPVLSIVVDPPSYFSRENPRGIYVPGPSPAGAGAWNLGANFWLKSEVQGSLELFRADRSTGFRTDFGSQISGNYTRNHLQKSLDVVFRDAYGAKQVDYPLFPDRPSSKFKRVRLRNSGNDFGVADLRDAFVNQLVKDSPIGWGSWAPAVVFIDGEYWGYMEIREKTSEDYLESAYGVDGDRLDLIDVEVAPVDGNRTVSDTLMVKAGTRTNYDALTGFVANHSMAVQSNYALVKEMIDVDNFASYWAAQLFIGNRDWPQNNVRMWRSQAEDGKWRWVFFDTDFAFGLYDQVTVNVFATIGNTSKMGRFIGQLVNNTEFRRHLINAMLDHLNGPFQQAAMTARLDAMVATLQPLIPELFARFNRQGKNPQAWVTAVQTIRNFIANREAVFLSQIRTRFGVGAGRFTIRLNANDLAMGNLKINTLDLSRRLTDVAKPWSGQYFTDVPITVTALPKPGYKFVQWQGASNSNQATVTLPLQADATLTALFAADPNPPPPPPPPPAPPPGLRNVALGATASQSSTQGPAGPGLAVDGDRNGALAVASLARTNSETNPWWQTDLGRVIDLHSVRLWNRTDCCADRLSELHVFVSQNSPAGRSYGDLLADNGVWRTYVAGPVGTSLTLPVGAKGRYVRVQLAGSGELALGEVEILALPVQPAIPDLGALRNLALGRQPSQSSEAQGGASGRAVDGNANGSFAALSTTLTAVEANPWWEVDLGASYPLSSVALANRTDCCGEQLANFSLLIANTPMNGRSLADLQQDPRVARVDVDGPVGRFIQIPSERIGRYVRVQLRGNGALALAEVAVMGLTQPTAPPGDM